MRTFIIALGSVAIIALCAFQISHLKNPSTNAYERFVENKMVKVQFNFSSFAEAELSDREKNDQVKDWLLLTILSTTTKSLDSLNQITFDLPSARYNSLKNVSEPEYGETRSRYIGDGTIVSLIPPPISDNEKIDILAHIADDNRKNVGEKPKDILVFEYQIDLEKRVATLTRRPSVACEQLYTKENGYTEMTVGSFTDFQAFINAISDVTYAQIKGDKLLLGGRNFKSRPYGKIKVEDIAAIYQSEESIKQDKNKFDSWQDTRIAELEASLQIKTRAGLPIDEEKVKADFQKEAQAKMKTLSRVDGSGFSLDPSYDCKKLLVTFERYVPMFKRTMNMSMDEEEEISAALREDNTDPFFEFLGKNPDGLWSQLIMMSIEGLRSQKARYDGYLQGTEVGMHLFYTDLLAKIWAINYKNTSPDFAINEFSDYDKLKIAKTFDKENEALPSCRLWFGGLIFTRNASQIYAASSNPLQPGKEVPASAFWETSLNWWNNHYEEVGRYEPEYEQLNQIIKWSVIIGWLNAQYDAPSLGYLMGVTVKRDNWFPEWAKNNHALKFDAWEKVGFFSKNHNGNKTEVMPILYSGHLSGGVSLATKTEIKALHSLRVTSNPILRRSGLDYAEAIGNNFKTLRGNTFKFETSGGRFKVFSEAIPEAKFRNRFGELKNETVERVFNREGNMLALEIKQGGKKMGDLRISDNFKNGFKIGFESAEIEQAQVVARGLSETQQAPEAYFKACSEVKQFYKSSEKIYTVELRGSNKWIEVEYNANSSVDLAETWQARISGMSENSKICNVKWLPESFKPNVSDFMRVASEQPSATSNLLGDFTQGNFRLAANKICASKDPLKLQQDLLQFYKKEMTELGETIGKGADCPDCMVRINRLEAIFMDKSEIQLLKGRYQLQDLNAAIANKQPNKVADILNQKMQSSGGDFLGEVNFLLEKSNPNLSKIANEVLSFSNGSKNIIKARIDVIDIMRIGERMEVQTVKNAVRGNNSCKLAVSDQPSLNNVDFSPSVEQTFSRIMELHPDAIVVRIPKQSLGSYRLKLTVDPATTTTSSTGKKLMRGANFRPSLQRNGFPCTEEEQRQGGCPPQTNSDLYVVYIPKAS
jgi:hypothetical protein